MPMPALARRFSRRALTLGSLLLFATTPASASAPDGSGRDAAGSVYLSRSWSLASPRFWWPAVVVERAVTNLRGVRSIDETRFGLMLAYRTGSVSPHLRALISPSLSAYQNVAGAAAAGVRVHFELGGLALSYGVGMSIEARLRDSLWLAYATPLELGGALYRGSSAEHHLFVGVRRSMAGALINSYLLDPNGYDNEDSLDRLRDLRDGRAWQLYVSLVFGRRVE